MQSIYLAAGAAGILTLFVACGGDDPPRVLPDGPGATGGKKGSPKPAGGEGGDDGGTFTRGGTGGRGNVQGNAGEGGSEDLTPNDPLAPVIIVTSPKQVTSPTGDVLTGSSVGVTCVVSQSTALGSSMVNESSVRLAVLDSKGKLVEEAGGVPTRTANEYSADLPLTNVPAGKVTFVCRAQDISNHAGSATVDSLLDKGPAITIAKPVATSAHALSEPLDIEFDVAAAPLTPDDVLAGVETVSLDVAGVNVELTDAEDGPGHYRLQVNLNDPQFNPTPNGTIPVTVRATNQRAPSVVEAVLTRQTSIDGAGPVIGITSPLDKDVVGGTVRLSFSVTDAISGADPDSVVVSLNNEEHPYDAASDRWTRTGDNFTFEFDSRQVKNSKVQITVNIGASDLVGNVSPVSSELLYLDNYPPLVDLDPMNVRTRNKAVPRRECSISFDPVGAAAKNDGDSAAIAGVFRALVWDQTNSAEEIDGHFSMTNPSSVRLYLEGDSSKPLLIDKDEDGACDDVAKVDSTNSIELDQIPVAGAPKYALSDADVAPSIAALDCVAKDMSPPTNLCTGARSDMWQVIEDTVHHIPLIYGVGVTPGLECTGVSWEFTGKLSNDGWVCFAARAAYYVGNVGVSRPLRLCVDDPSVAGTPACANSSVAPPSCTDGCVPPARIGNVGIEIP